MPLNLLGKLLFPRLQFWQRRRRVKVILAVLLAALTFAAIVGVMIYLENARR